MEEKENLCNISPLRKAASSIDCIMDGLVGNMVANQGKEFVSQVSNTLVNMDVSDTRKLLAWGVVGAAGFIAYQAFSEARYKTVVSWEDFDEDIRDDLTQLPAYTKLAREFLKLQNYRKINDYCFKTAVWYTDHLLVYHTALKREVPTPTDMKTSIMFYTTALSRLEALCIDAESIRQLPREHTATVRLIVDDIRPMMISILKDIVARCKYDPSKMIERARKDIDQYVWDRTRSSRRENRRDAGAYEHQDSKHRHRPRHHDTPQQHTKLTPDEFIEKYEQYIASINKPLENQKDRVDVADETHSSS